MDTNDDGVVLTDLEVLGEVTKVLRRIRARNAEVTRCVQAATRATEALLELEKKTMFRPPHWARVVKFGQVRR